MSSSSSSRNRASRRRGRGNTRTGGNQSIMLRGEARSQTGGVRSGLVTSGADFTTRPPSALITQSPPRNIRSKIHWFQESFTKDSSHNVSSSIDTEVNYSFSIGDFPGGPGLCGYFDQYCIYAVICNITPNGAGFSSNSANFGRLTTAIDFDNTTSLGSESTVQRFATSQTVEIQYPLHVQRVLKPCNTESLYGSGFGSYGIGRFWVDSVSQGVNHYGLRTYWRNNISSNFNFDLTCVMIVGFRNSN